MTSVSATPEEGAVLEIMTYSMELVDFYKDVELEFEKEYPHIDLEFIAMPQNKNEKQQACSARRGR